MPWVFAIEIRSPGGTAEHREFTVYDERLATILRRVLFDKNASAEQLEEFAREVSGDPELAREWSEVSLNFDYLKVKIH